MQRYGHMLRVILAATALCRIGPAFAQSTAGIVLEDRDRPAVADHGNGPGVAPRGPAVSVWSKFVKTLSGQTQSGAATLSTTAVARSAASPNPAITGMFGPVTPWPVIPLHMALLPDGRVMSYGTDDTGKQGAQLYYDIWDPTLGTGTNSHMLLPNNTATDLFCTGLGLLTDGTLLLTGGDFTINGVRNFSNNHTNIFYPKESVTGQDILKPAPAGAMQYKRWYPSIIPLPNGDQIVAGGISSPGTPVTIPEYYSIARGTTPASWRTLTGADSHGASEWYYPRIFVGSLGTIYLINTNGNIYSYTTAVDPTTGIGGTFNTVATAALPPSLEDLPSLMFRPGSILSVRQPTYLNATTGAEYYGVDVIDITGSKPVVTPVRSLPGGREWANLTSMADGKVLANGGSGQKNMALVRPSFDAYIYDPVTYAWTLAATAQKVRLYHSTSLMLLDGTILTGGGGAPAPADVPVNNLNVEIYYPPYLFAADGTLAPRPTITSISPITTAGKGITVTMSDATPMHRVTMHRLGAVTHSANLQQRFFGLGFTQAGNVITAGIPTNSNLLLPGFYMVFVFNNAGVPSVAKVVEVQLPS